MYEQDIDRQKGDVVDGRPTYLYIVTETGEIPVDAEWILNGVPRQATITLTEAVINVGDGITEIQTETGWQSGFVNDGNFFIDEAESPGAPIRIAQQKLFTNAAGQLFGRTRPNQVGGPTSKVTTYLSVTLGHL